MPLREKTDSEIISMVAALKGPTTLETEMMTRLCEKRAAQPVQVPQDVMEVFVELPFEMVPRSHAQAICAVFMLITMVTTTLVMCD